MQLQSSPNAFAGIQHKLSQIFTHFYNSWYQNQNYFPNRILKGSYYEKTYNSFKKSNKIEQQLSKIYHTKTGTNFLLRRVFKNHFTENKQQNFQKTKKSYSPISLSFCLIS